jgi:hypothetical protein
MLLLSARWISPILSGRNIMTDPFTVYSVVSEILDTISDVGDETFWIQNNTDEELFCACSIPMVHTSVGWFSVPPGDKGELASPHVHGNVIPHDKSVLFHVRNSTGNCQWPGRDSGRTMYVGFPARGYLTGREEFTIKWSRLRPAHDATPGSVLKVREVRAARRPLGKSGIVTISK